MRPEAAYSAKTIGRVPKIEVVRPARERGLGVAQTARYDAPGNVLRKRANESAAEPGQAFPGQGQMKLERLATERSGRQVAKQASQCAGENGRGHAFTKRWICLLLEILCLATRLPSQRCVGDEVVGAKIDTSSKPSSHGRSSAGPMRPAMTARRFVYQALAGPVAEVNVRGSAG